MTPTCNKCAHLEMVKGRIVYAVCRKTNRVFETFPRPDEPTPETFTCDQGKPGLPHHG